MDEGHNRDTMLRMRLKRRFLFIDIPILSEGSFRFFRETPKRFITLFEKR
jgi:hypothetical protein